MNLERIEIGAFCGIRKLSKLVLNYNKLTSLPQLCSLKCCLDNLEVASNSISRLSKHFFKGFKKLRMINLSNNNLIVLPDVHWIQHSVSTIKAMYNGIQSLHALRTSGLYARLQHVTFIGNDIQDFNISILRHMPNLDYFDLNGNKLNHIDDFRNLYVRAIYLRSNPWHCGVELSWMGEDDNDFEQGLTCATPTCLHGMAIADMSKWIILSINLRFLMLYCLRVMIDMWKFNTLRPSRNRRHFADDIFKCIFLNENVLISIKISLKYIPKGPINNIPALVQIMAWGRPGDKPSSEPMMIISLTHICVSWPQWVNTMKISVIL